MGGVQARALPILCFLRCRADRCSSLHAALSHSQAAAQQSADTLSAAWLMTSSGETRAELYGFMVRRVRADIVQGARHVFTTEWVTVNGAPWEPNTKSILALRSDGSATTRCSGRLPSTAPCKAMARSDGFQAVVVLWHSNHTASALPILEMGVAVVQALASTLSKATPLLFIQASSTASGAQHAGVWGLARTARAEELLHAGCQHV